MAKNVSNNLSNEPRLKRTSSALFGAVTWRFAQLHGTTAHESKRRKTAARQPHNPTCRRDTHAVAVRHLPAH